MVRRSIPAAKIDDRTFGIRVRIEVPELGLRERSVELHRWMDERLGRQGYAVHGGGFDGYGGQSIFVYCNDPDAIAECVKAVGLTVHGFPKETP